MENSCFNLLGQYLPRNLAQHENSYPSPLEGNYFSLPAWLGCNVTLVGVTAPCGTQNLLFDKALRFKRFIQATALHNRGKFRSFLPGQFPELLKKEIQFLVRMQK